MKNILLPALMIAFCFSACKVYRYKPLSKTPAQNNSTYEIEYLFEHDGCKVYRFRDGHDVYFTNCNGQTISYSDSSTVIQNTTQHKN